MNTFFKLPVTASPRIGKIDPAKIVPLSGMLGVPEATSYDDWLFDNNLTGAVNSRLLTPTANRYTVENELLKMNNLSSSLYMAMKSPLTTVATTGFTIAVVAKETGWVDGSFAFAGYQQAGVNGTASLSLSSVGIGGVVQGRGFENATRFVTNSKNWFFAAASFSNETNVKRNLLVANIAAGIKTDTFVGTGALANPSGTFNAVCVGPTYITSAQTVNFEFAEFIVFDRALSIDELKLVYLRTQKRMKIKNIDV